MEGYYSNCTVRVLFRCGGGVVYTDIPNFINKVLKFMNQVVNNSLSLYTFLAHLVVTTVVAT